MVKESECIPSAEADDDLISEIVKIGGVEVKLNVKAGGGEGGEGGGGGGGGAAAAAAGQACKGSKGEGMTSI